MLPGTAGNGTSRPPSIQVSGLALDHGGPAQVLAVEDAGPLPRRQGDLLHRQIPRRASVVRRARQGQGGERRAIRADQGLRDVGEFRRHAEQAMPAGQRTAVGCGAERPDFRLRSASRSRRAGRESGRGDVSLSARASLRTPLRVVHQLIAVAGPGEAGHAERVVRRDPALPYARRPGRGADDVDLVILPGIHQGRAPAGRAAA
jgi:hypothetical protein